MCVRFLLVQWLNVYFLFCFFFFSSFFSSKSNTNIFDIWSGIHIPSTCYLWVTIRVVEGITLVIFIHSYLNMHFKIRIPNKT